MLNEEIAEALEAPYNAAERQGREAERKAVAAWLRSKSQFDDQLGHARLMRHLAACIEDGDHLGEEKTEEVG
jgi:hypothetical protein